MSGCEVNREALPDFTPYLFSKGVGQRLAAVNVKVINHQMTESTGNPPVIRMSEKRRGQVVVRLKNPRHQTDAGRRQ
jgi:hypothetical protein